MSNERRGYIRYSTELETYCQEGKEARLDRFWRIARVHDLSATGIGLVLNQKLGAGTLLTVELANQSESRLILARVVHAVAQGRSGWLTGCIFDEGISDSEVKALLS